MSFFIYKALLRFKKAPVDNFFKGRAGEKSVLTVEYFFEKVSPKINTLQSIFATLFTRLNFLFPVYINREKTPPLFYHISKRSYNDYQDTNRLVNFFHL